MSNESTKDANTSHKEITSHPDVTNTSHKETTNSPDIKNTDLKDYKTWKSFRARFRRVFSKAKIFVLVGNFVLVIVKAHKLEHSTIWSVRLWRWCVFALSYIYGKWIAVFVVVLFREIILYKVGPDVKFHYFARKVTKGFEVFLRLGLGCVAWGFLFDFHVKRTEDAKKEAQYITKGIVGCVIGDAIWVTKTVLVNLVGLSHVSKCHDNIEAAERDKRNTFFFLSIPELEKQKQKQNDNSKWWNCYDLSKFELPILNEVFTWTQGEEIFKLYYKTSDAKGNTKTKEIKDQKEVIECAKRTVQLLKRQDHRHPNEEAYIKMEELFKYVDDENLKIYFEALAEKKNGENYIRGSDFVQWAEKVYVNYKDKVKKVKRWTDNLKYKNLAVDELERLVSVIVVIIIIIVWLLFMDFLSTKMLIFIATQLLLGTFVVGDSLKTIFGSVMFVFAYHPFDIGDHVLIDGIKLTVIEMTLLKTIFLKHNEDEVSYYYPNFVLSSKVISTWRPKPSENVEPSKPSEKPSENEEEKPPKPSENVEGRHPRPSENVEDEEEDNDIDEDEIDKYRRRTAKEEENNSIMEPLLPKQRRIKRGSKNSGLPIRGVISRSVFGAKISSFYK